jgi:hypothetical protein
MTKLLDSCCGMAVRRILPLALWLAWMAVPPVRWAGSIGWAAEEGPVIRIPGATAYVAPNPEGARITEEGVQRWIGPDQKILFFGEFAKPGKVRARLTVALPPEATSRLQLSLDKQSLTATVQGGAAPVTRDLGELEVGEPGYQKFVLSSLNEAGQANGRIESLELSGPAVEQAHFNLDPRRNAASVHLAYPEGREAEVAWFYSEVTAVDDPVTTFYMACGFRRGYFGMQVNSPTERRIIFSVWDAGTGNSANDRSEVAEENHVSLIGKGEGVHTSVFGGEGTGGHSHLKYNWKTGETQKFLVTAEPVGTEQTIYSGFYFHPEKQEWMLISSMKAPKDGHFLRGLHGFSENFWGSTGHLRRKALFGNQWVRLADGTWRELTVATFSHDPTGKDHRRDRFMGIERGQFFLSHGGFVPGFTKFGDRFERPAVGTPPQIQPGDLPPR